MRVERPQATRLQVACAAPRVACAAPRVACAAPRVACAAPRVADGPPWALVRSEPYNGCYADRVTAIVPRCRQNLCQSTISER